MKRNGTIEFFRFVFSIMILMLHFTKDIPWHHDKFNFAGGAIGVEFFFLVSGWLFAKSLDKEKETNHVGPVTAKFIRRKIGGLYPEFFIAWVHAFLLIHILRHTCTLSKLARDALEGLGELLLVWSAGLGSLNFVRGSWYLSVMILAMFLLFPIAIRNKDRFFYVTAPLISIFLTGTIYVCFGKVRTIHGLFLGCINSGLLRGIAEISLGCVCYKLSVSLASREYGRRMRTLLGIIEMVCYLVVLVFAVFLAGYLEKEAGLFDFPMLVMMAAAVTISFSGVSIWTDIFNNPVSWFLGKFSFPLYLGHGISIKILRRGPFEVEGLKCLCLYLFFCVLHAGLIMLLAGWWRKHGRLLVKKLVDVA